MELNKINSSMTNWGAEAANLNENFDKVSTAIEQVKNATIKSKGYFSSESALKLAIPTAAKGDKAYVGNNYPYQIWIWNGSSWGDSGSVGGEESVNLGNYHTKEYTDAKLSELGSKVNTYNLNVLTDKTYETLSSALSDLNTLVPQKNKVYGTKVIYNDNEGKTHEYTFLSDTGFTNITRWMSNIVNPYIESLLSIGAVRLSDLVKSITISAIGDIDVNAEYRFSVCGNFGTRTSFALERNDERLGYIDIDIDTLKGSAILGNMNISIALNSLESISSVSFDYTKYNKINRQLFINAYNEYKSSIQRENNIGLRQIVKDNTHNISNLNDACFEDSIEVLDVDYVDGYFAATGGAPGTFKIDNTRTSTSKITVKEGEKYLITTIIGGSTAISYLAQWDGDNWVGIGDDFKPNSGNAVDREYIVPEGVTHIAVGSYNTQKPIIKKVSASEETAFYKKEEVYKKEEINDIVKEISQNDNSVKIYGVKTNINEPTLTAWERTGSSVGMSASVQVEGSLVGKDDFIDVYPYNSIKECNVVRLSNGATKIIYRGEEGYSTDNDCFIEFPLWYERRYIKDGYEYREICEQQIGGFYPSPMFIEGGRVLDRVYIAKYETSADNEGIARSISNSTPLSYLSLSEFRDLYKSKGDGYSGMDIRTVMSIQHLYLVRFAEKNTQNYIGGGYTDLYQPWGFGSKDYSGTAGLGGGELMTKNYVKTYRSASLTNTIKKTYWVGKQIGFVKSNESKLYDRATITNIEYSDDGKQATIYFDKNVEIITEASDAAVSNSTTPIRTWFGGCGQNTGATDVLSHDTGRTSFKVESNHGSCAVKLFGLENMWGNVWHELDGLIFKEEYAYIGFSQKDYNNNGNGYIPISRPMLEQNVLGDVGAQFCFIGNMWLDNAYPWVAYPSSVRGGSPTDKTMPSEGITQNNSYGDAYYFNPTANEGINIEVHGGGFDHYERAGLFCHRCWNSLDFKWYLQGSRMQFKLL